MHSEFVREQKGIHRRNSAKSFHVQKKNVSIIRKLKEFES